MGTPRDLFSAWWMIAPKGATHISEYRLRFHHGRHRPVSNRHVRFVAGEWCRPAEVLTWEPIERT